MYHLIGLGSNWHAAQQMEKMLKCFDTLVKRICSSDVIKTLAYGDASVPCYLNAVVLIQTTMDEQNIARWCKQQEKMLGRRQFATAGECEADFDVLLSWSEEEAVPSLTHIKETYYLTLARNVLFRTRDIFLTQRIVS